MAIRKIQNLTIFSDLNEQITLPTTVLAVNDDLSQSYESVTWYPTSVDTSVPADLVFVGTVAGYPEKVLLSCIIDGIEESPPSSFPDEIDEFGNPKVDIQTADIPDIDDFQYFKAKYPRSMAEGYQLMQLRELLADKVILARDINHMRNAIIELEKYAKKLADEIEILKARVTKLEQETIINGHNLGSGEGVFESVGNRIMNFKSIKGSGDVNVSSNGSEIDINVEIPPPTAGCGINVRAKDFEICENNTIVKFPMRIEDGIFNFTNTGSFSFRMVKLKAGARGNFNSLLMVLGQGQDGGRGAGRLLKCGDGFILETQNNTQGNSFSGLEIRASNTNFYHEESSSKINQEIEGSPNIYNMSELVNIGTW